MSASPPATGGFTRRFWLWAAAAVGIQFLCIVLLNERGTPRVRSTDREPSVTMSEGLGGDWAEWVQPTLFAWSGTRGFSGPTLHAAKTVTYQPPRYSEPLRFLALESDDLSGMTTAMPGQGEGLTLPPFPPSSPAPREVPDVLVSPPLPGPSSCELSDSLAARLLQPPPLLPAWTNADLLPDTVVQLRLDAMGTVLSCVLVARSGLAEADTFAVELARRLRFRALATTPRHRPGPVPPLVTGQATFRWQALPPKP